MEVFGAEKPSLPAGARGPRILHPLRIRNFRLLFAGTSTSLIGDGIYLVAIAWQVYDISNVPTALSLVGVAWTLPIVLFVLIGGVLGDRFERRRLLIVSDVIRGIAIAAIGALSIAGVLELWHVIVLVAFYGVGEALFGPSFEAIIPDVVPKAMLVQANSLQQLAEPVGLTFLGPAIGGALIALLGGPGQAFLVDAATFWVSATCIAFMRPRRPVRSEQSGSVLADLREGLAFIRERRWIWGTLVASALSLLFFFGPLHVLLPYLVRNELGGSAAVLGFVYAASGVGAIVSGLTIGQRGMGERHVLWMYVGWAVAIGCLAGYALTSSAWQAVAIGIVEGIAFTIGNITWSTLLQLHTPAEKLSRVTSFDWLLAIGLTPISFAIAGPVAEAIGVRATMIGAGVFGAAAMLAFLALPGIRDPEQTPPPKPAEAAEAVEATG